LNEFFCNNKLFCQGILSAGKGTLFKISNIQHLVNIIKYLIIAKSETLILMKINAAAVSVFNFSYKSNRHGVVKSRISSFNWIPAFAGMTIKQLISTRYDSRHTREGGYPDVKITFCEIIK